MNWLRSTLDGAGFANVRQSTFVAAVLAAAGLLALWVSWASSILALGACVGLASAGLAFEFLAAKAKMRRARVSKSWPEIVEVIVSGIASGVAIQESFEELRDNGPKFLRNHFAVMVRIIDNGSTLDAALVWLKTEIAEVHADRTIELLRISNEVGGGNLAASLRHQTKQIRAELALWGEIESKQGWVVGTAKLAVAAPWMIVGMLAVRPENAAVYNSTAGAGILVVGLVISVFAYRLIHYLAALPQIPRVFAKVGS